MSRWAGFTIGWLYWWFWAVVLAVEATAGAKIVNGWIPALPQWLLALILMTLLTATNLFSVGSYGEFEFWFSCIKVVAIAVFIVLGLLAIFVVLPGTHAVGMSNLTGHGGFFPHGYGAVITGLLTVVFAFMGSEIVTIAAGESQDPGRAVTRAVNSVIWRILVFYLGSIAVVIALLPWNAGARARSVCQRSSVPGVDQQADPA
ncbi:amino acid permease [Actinoallomurus spadix]|uniref:amino acid permease n=1 Tax=Actinoallomurus spadix TaxID=79912 RepID=UPI0027E39929|nr:amino acid permease [Actinoallomurus spadix]